MWPNQCNETKWGESSSAWVSGISGCFWKSLSPQWLLFGWRGHMMGLRWCCFPEFITSGSQGLVPPACRAFPGATSGSGGAEHGSVYYPGVPVTSCPSLAGTGDPESLRWAMPSGVAKHSWVLTSPFFLRTALRCDYM